MNCVHFVSFYYICLSFARPYCVERERIEGTIYIFDGDGDLLWNLTIEMKRSAKRMRKKNRFISSSGSILPISQLSIAKLKFPFAFSRSSPALERNDDGRTGFAHYFFIALQFRLARINMRTGGVRFFHVLPGNFGTAAPPVTLLFSAPPPLLLSSVSVRTRMLGKLVPNLFSAITNTSYIVIGSKLFITTDI